MINVLFFGQVREWVNCDRLQLESTFLNVEELRASLAEKDSRWAQALASEQLLAAVNQTMVSFDNPLHEGDEVAFFPPVTGG